MSRQPPVQLHFNTSYKLHRKRVEKKIDENTTKALTHWAKDAAAEARANAHVVTGQMRRLTRYSHARKDAGGTISVKWGGYARHTVHEIARGGDHDYLTPVYRKYKRLVATYMKKYPL